MLLHTITQYADNLQIFRFFYFITNISYRDLKKIDVRRRTLPGQMQQQAGLSKVNWYVWRILAWQMKSYIDLRYTTQIIIYIGMRNQSRHVYTYITLMKHSNNHQTEMALNQQKRNSKWNMFNDNELYSILYGLWWNRKVSIICCYLLKIV